MEAITSIAVSPRFGIRMLSTANCSLKFERAMIGLGFVKYGDDELVKDMPNENDEGHSPGHVPIEEHQVFFEASTSVD